MRCLLAVAALLFGVPAHAQQGIEPGDTKLRLVLEQRAQAPYPGEMVLLSIHGTFKIAVVREKLQQPTLKAFDWMQLGEDRWYKDFEDGFEVLKFERRMALFPRQSGQLDVTPFTHELEMLSRRGETIPVAQTSNGLMLEVAEQPETEDWWFPVRAIEVSDRWSNQPEALEPGGAALRVVTLTVKGSAAQRIPPMPALTGAGAHIFPHPDKRLTTLGPDGPVTRVFWRWTVRPDQDSAGYLNPLRIAYFDTKDRETKEIKIAAQRVAYKNGPQVVRPSSGQVDATRDVAQSSSTWAFELPNGSLPLAVISGFLIVATIGLRKGQWRWPAWLRRDPLLNALRREVRRKNYSAVRRIGHKIVSRHQTEAPIELLQLDQSLFGKDRQPPPLGDVARAVRAAVSGIVTHKH